jgi:NAD(P)H-quinone oxidoreductase subunit 3
MELLPEYVSFWALLFIALLVPVLAFSISSWIAPNSQSPEKHTTYESGIEPIGESWIQFEIRYYMFALVFVVFDVETLFLYPWAVSFSDLGLLAFLEAFVFIFVLVLGLIYAWRKGALEWS